MINNEDLVNQKEENFFTYYAACHCEKVTVELKFPSNADIEECNCSICYQKGFLHMLIPKSDFKLISADQEFSYLDDRIELQEKEIELMDIYQFGTKTAKHLSCKICHITCYYYPRSHPEGVSINARCVKGGIPNSIHNVTHFDGRNYETNLEALRAKDKNKI